MAKTSPSTRVPAMPVAVATKQGVFRAAVVPSKGTATGGVRATSLCYSIIET
jgi:hypothetical protein